METLVFWKDHTNFYCTTIPQMPPGEKAAGERKGLTCLFRFQYRQGGALVKANMCKGCARVSWGIREGTCLRLWIGCCRELCKVYHSRRRRQAEGKAWPGVTFVKAIMCKFQSEMCEGLRKGLVVFPPSWGGVLVLKCKVRLVCLALRTAATREAKSHWLSGLCAWPSLFVRRLSLAGSILPICKML